MDDYFTASNVLAVMVGTTAVTVVANALQKLARLNPKWTAFVAALVLAYLVVAMKTEPMWYDWVLAFFNACLLYCAAYGINETGALRTARPGEGFARGEPFFTSWNRSG